MSMYLSNEDVGPTGWEASEFIDSPFTLDHLVDEVATVLEEGVPS